MLTFIRNSGLAAIIGLTSLSFPSFVSAQTLELELGQDGPKLRVQDDCNLRRNRNLERCQEARGDDDFDGNNFMSREERRREERRREERRRDERVAERRCSPEQALEKAEDMGLRRARISNVGRRTISVRGRDRGERVTVVFARDRRCSIIR